MTIERNEPNLLTCEGGVGWGNSEEDHWSPAIDVDLNKKVTKT